MLLYYIQDLYHLHQNLSHWGTLPSHQFLHLVELLLLKYQFLHLVELLLLKYSEYDTFHNSDHRIMKGL